MREASSSRTATDTDSYAFFISLSNQSPAGGVSRRTENFKHNFISSKEVLKELQQMHIPDLGRILYNQPTIRNRKTAMTMDNIKGKSILIGREPKTGQLMIAVKGSRKAAVIGKNDSVPRSVSRCIIEKGIAHAMLEIDPHGVMTIYNMKPQNVTLVNGAEISTKRVSVTNSAELGWEHYHVNIQTIINTASKLLPPPAPKFNILPLKRVYDKYEKGIAEIDKRMTRLNLLCRIPFILTLSASVITSFSVIYEWGLKITIVTAALALTGLIIMCYGIYRSITSNPSQEKKELRKELEDKCICPNPECHRFLGNMSYKLLKREYKMHCPYCKCEFFEK